MRHTGQRTYVNAVYTKIVRLAANWRLEDRIVNGCVLTKLKSSVGAKLIVFPAPPSVNLFRFGVCADASCGKDDTPAAKTSSRRKARIIQV